MLTASMTPDQRLLPSRVVLHVPSDTAIASKSK